MQVPRLRQWWEYRALTQEELAERVGVSVRSIAGYEGGAGARPATVRALSDALDVDVSALLEAPDAPKVQEPRSQLKEDEERRRRGYALALSQLLGVMAGGVEQAASGGLVEGGEYMLDEARDLAEEVMQLASAGASPSERGWLETLPPMIEDLREVIEDLRARLPEDELQRHREQRERDRARRLEEAKNRLGGVSNAGA